MSHTFTPEDFAVNHDAPSVTPIRLRDSTAGEPRLPVAPERLREGAPLQSVLNQFSNAAGSFHCGTWSSSEGCWSIRYTEDEFCYLLEGRVVLEDEQGGRWRFETGDAFVIPSGFRGSWRSLGNVRKFYALYEAP